MIGQSFAKTILTDGEQIQFVQRPHWFVYIPAIIWFIIPIIGWGIALKIIIANICTEIVVTNRRLIVKRGFIKRNTEQISFLKMEEINLDQSIIGRIFDYGNVSVEGTGGGKIYLNFIDSPTKIIKQLNNSLNIRLA